MECQYFGVCGSCQNFEGGYAAQLQRKVEENRKRFAPFYHDKITVFPSPQINYRYRAEFRIWHDKESISYAMTSVDKKPLVINACPQVAKPIEVLMPKLLEQIQSYNLKEKLFGVDFLASTTGELVATMLYHKRLDEQWEQKAHEIAKKLGISIIGRSRKQKVIIGKEYVIEHLRVYEREFFYKYIENSFTQPNSRVNERMIEWVLEDLNPKGDLLELYCGAGNFTIPFATKFPKVLATEISKSSIAAAKENMKLNGITNIEFVRMSVEEFCDALMGVRVFNRMKHINIEEYNFSTIFVDPPRAGIDEKSLEFVQRFKNIIYISCNPVTLYDNLQILHKTHKVESMALFDQFPYTHHVEMGVKLTKR